MEMDNITILLYLYYVTAETWQCTAYQYYDRLLHVSMEVFIHISNPNDDHVGLILQ